MFLRGKKSYKWICAVLSYLLVSKKLYRFLLLQNRVSQAMNNNRGYTGRYLFSSGGMWWKYETVQRVSFSKLSLAYVHMSLSNLASQNFFFALPMCSFSTSVRQIKMNCKSIISSYFLFDNFPILTPADELLFQMHCTTFYKRSLFFHALHFFTLATITLVKI